MNSMLSIVLGMALAGQTASPRYFPEGSFDDSQKLSERRDDWYSQELRKLGEPSLLDMSKGKDVQVYRFLWLRAFHHPVCIRLDVLPDGTGLLTTKMLSGVDGEKDTKLILNDQQVLNRTDWFLTLFSKQGFWDIKPFDHSVMGFDGAEWIIEVAKEGKYHVVDRWSPEKGPVYSLGMAMLRMSKL